MCGADMCGVVVQQYSHFEMAAPSGLPSGYFNGP